MLLVRPVGQTEKPGASATQPRHLRHQAPGWPCLFLSQRTRPDQLEVYGQVTRMPPYAPCPATTSPAHSTPRPVAVGGNCYTSGGTLTKSQNKAFYAIFFGRFSFQKQKACFLFCNSAGSPGPNADTGCTWAGSLSGVGHSKVNLVVTHIQLIHHMNT